MVWQEIVATHKHAKLHNLATLFDNTNVVGNPEKGDRIVRGVFCQTFTKSCQITNNTGKILQNFFIQRFTLTMDPILTVLLRLIRQNSKFESGGQAHPEKSGGPGSMQPPRFRHLCLEQ